jgi:hypothetical protein
MKLPPFPPEINNVEKFDVANAISDENKDLRSELQFLKNCQVRYFILSITASSLVVGFGEKLVEGNKSVYLAPLLVILPCWWIFFDKATTISRIVAYLRILEQLIIDRSQNLKYKGWENSVQEFRDNAHQVSRKYGFSKKLLETVKALVFKSPHKYWIINWFTFCGLSSISVIMSHPKTDLLWYAALIISIACAFNTASILGNLCGGKYSFKNNFEIWKKLLTNKSPS